MSAAQKPTEPLLWNDEFLRLLNSISAEIKSAEALSKKDTLIRYHTLIAIGGYVGPRAKEFLNLTWYDVVGKHRGEIFQFKQGRPRQVYFHPKLINLIDNNYKALDPDNVHDLILHKQGDPLEPIKTQQFNQNFARRLAKAGITTQQPSSHTLRKTFGMHIYRDIYGATEEGLVMACKLLDHESIEETIKYIGLTDDRIKQTFLSF